MASWWKDARDPIGLVSMAVVVGGMGYISWQWFHVMISNDLYIYYFVVFLVVGGALCGVGNQGRGLFVLGIILLAGYFAWGAILQPLHREALARFRAADWEIAAAGFAQLARREPEARLHRVFLERIEALRRAPPGPDWDGTFTHREK